MRLIIGSTRYGGSNGHISSPPCTLPPARTSHSCPTGGLDRPHGHLPRRFRRGALPAHVHAVTALDQAGWHGSEKLTVPNNVSLAPLPLYSPELNPVERVWLFLRERFLSFRVLDDQEAVIDGCCDAWNALAAETGRLKSLSSYPWITKVSS